MINKKHNMLIEHRLARLEKLLSSDKSVKNEGRLKRAMRSDLQSVFDDHLGSEDCYDDEREFKENMFALTQGDNDPAVDSAIMYMSSDFGYDEDLLEDLRDDIADALAKMADDLDLDYDDDDDDDWDDDDWDDDDMYESRRRKLERRVRVLERRLVDEGILDGIKNLAGKITGKAAGAKLSAEELVEKVKAELTNIVGGITNKIDDKVGSCNWVKSRGGNSELKWVSTKESGGSVMSTSTGDNRDLPHTKRAKDTITVQATVDTDKAKSLKDCVVNYDISINSNATTAKAPKPITGSAKLLSMFDSKAWEKIVNKFIPSYISYVNENT